MLADAISNATEAEFVSFFAGGQSFSLAITQVREIRRWSPVTPLPNAPRELLGVMNLRVGHPDLRPCRQLRSSSNRREPPERHRGRHA